MMNIVHFMLYTLYAALAGYLLWGLFMISMTLLRAKREGTLTNTARLLGGPYHYGALLLDIFLNWTFFSALVWDLPRELTITKHICRLKCDKKTAPWRVAICAWMCLHLLDPFDPDGIHCTCPPENKNEPL
jgi:hypothetical protein